MRRTLGGSLARGPRTTGLVLAAVAMSVVLGASSCEPPTPAWSERLSNRQFDVALEDPGSSNSPPAVDTWVVGGFGGSAFVSRVTEGSGHAVKVRSESQLSSWIVQDDAAPIANRSFVFSTRVRRVAGSQTIHLLHDWDRGANGLRAGDSIAVQFNESNTTFSTDLAAPADQGTATLPPLPLDEWVTFRVEFDQGAHTARVLIDGVEVHDLTLAQPAVAFPGVITVAMGSCCATLPGPSEYLFDDVSLLVRS